MHFNKWFIDWDGYIHLEFGVSVWEGLKSPNINRCRNKSIVRTKELDSKKSFKLPLNENQDHHVHFWMEVFPKLSSPRSPFSFRPSRISNKSPFSFLSLSFDSSYFNSLHFAFILASKSLAVWYPPPADIRLKYHLVVSLAFFFFLQQGIVDEFRALLFSFFPLFHFLALSLSVPSRREFLHNL